MNDLKKIKYDPAKIAVYAHKKSESLIGVSIEKCNNILKILLKYEVDASKKNEEEVEGYLLIFNEKGYYEVDPNNIRSFKIIELTPEIVI